MLRLDKEVFLIYARGNVNGTLIEVLISQSANNIYLSKQTCSITSSIIT